MNKKRGTISFEANGESHEYRLTTNAMCVYEDSTGRTLIAGMADLSADDGLSVGRVRELFAAGLGKGMDEAALEAAGELIDGLGLERAAGIIVEGAEAAFPKPKEQEGNAKKGKETPAT